MGEEKEKERWIEENEEYKRGAGKEKGLKEEEEKKWTEEKEK